MATAVATVPVPQQIRSAIIRIVNRRAVDPKELKCTEDWDSTSVIVKHFELPISAEFNAMGLVKLKISNCTLTDPWKISDYVQTLDKFTTNVGAIYFAIRQRHFYKLFMGEPIGIYLSKGVVRTQTNEQIGWFHPTMGFQQSDWLKLQGRSYRKYIKSILYKLKGASPDPAS